MLKLLDISEVNDSTHTIYWPTKCGLKVTWAIYRPDEKVMKSWNWTFHKWLYLKPSNLNFASIFKHVKNKIVEFTDSTNTIYWPAKIAQEVASSWKWSFYICQY